MSEFVKAVQRIMKLTLKKQQRRGKAINISLNKCTCDVDLGNGAMLHSVKLKAIEAGDSNGIVLVPKEKSYVVAAMVEDVEADWCITNYSEIDSAAFFFKNGGKLEMKNDGTILLNGDNLDGLVKAGTLTTKLNTLENEINTIKSYFAAWIVVPNDGGAALKTVFSAWSGQPLTPTTQTEIENTKVKHGA